MICQTHSFSRPHEAGVSARILPVDPCRSPSTFVDEPWRNHAAGNRGDGSSRRGVALIIVLGMLALLMILGVAFSITMRTERMSANYYVHQIRADHLSRVSLARAVDRLGRDLEGSIYPDWANDILASRGGGTSDGFLSTEVRRHLPDYNWDQLSALVDDNVEWVAAPEGIGRYAYLVINTSGLLDANYAGGGNRHYGVDASEIVLNADASFFSARDRHRRFESLSELTDAWRSPATMNIRPPVPLGRLTEDGEAAHDQILVTVSAGELLARRDDIIEAFERSGLSGNPMDNIGMSPAEIAFYNLIDYVDGDGIPANLAGTINPEDIDYRIPSVEANPMFNEFFIEYTLDVEQVGEDQWRYDAQGMIRFELAWLFPAELYEGPYRFHYHVSFESDVSGNAFAYETLSGEYGYNPLPSPPEYYEIEVEMYPPTAETVDALPGAFEVDATITTWVKNSAGIVVDTNMPLTVTLPFNIASTPAEPVTTYRGMECIEPRLNYFERVAGFDNWVETSGEGGDTIGSLNHWTSVHNDEHVESDGLSPFYVANRPLHTVGELGYLFYGTPWQTIRLYRHLDGDYLIELQHDVLDYFTIHDGGWKQGLVNPNTEIRSVLEDALIGMPYAANPDASSPVLTQAQARDIAEAWILDVWEPDGPGSSPRFIENLSEIGRFETVFHHTFLAGRSEPEKEALIRNAAHLFHPRQNHFTIILAVNTFGIGGQTIGKRRYVAEVWRDPYPGQDGNHRTYLRSLLRVD